MWWHGLTSPCIACTHARTHAGRHARWHACNVEGAAVSLLLACQHSANLLSCSSCCIAAPEVIPNSMDARFCISGPMYPAAAAASISGGKLIVLNLCYDRFETVRLAQRQCPNYHNKRKRRTKERSSEQLSCEPSWCGDAMRLV